MARPAWRQAPPTALPSARARRASAGRVSMPSRSQPTSQGGRRAAGDRRRRRVAMLADYRPPGRRLEPRVDQRKHAAGRRRSASAGRPPPADAGRPGAAVPAGPGRPGRRPRAGPLRATAGHCPVRPEASTTRGAPELDRLPVGHEAAHPGNGSKARRRRSIAAAGCVQSIARFGLVDLVRVADALGSGCGVRRSAPGVSAGACTISARAQRGQAVVQRGGAVVGARSARPRASSIGAGVQAGVHLHDGDAGLRVAGLDGTVDRRRAAPARQQRGVDVQAAPRRQRQHPGRQDQAVGGHHQHVGRAPRPARRGPRGVVGELAVQPQAARLRPPAGPAPAPTA